MTRFRSIVYTVLVLSLLLSYAPIGSSEEIKPVTYRAEFIPFGKGLTWKKLIPADSGPLTLDFEMVLSPGTITAEVAGDILFYDRTETLKVRGTGGKLSSDGGVVLKGAIVLDFMIPMSPLLEVLFGVNESIHIDQRIKIPALNVNKGWNESKAFNSFLLNVGEGEKVRMEVGVPKLVTLKLSAVDIVPTVASTILSGGTLTGAVKLFVDKLTDYLDTGIALNAGLTSELVLFGKSVTVNGTPIRHEDQRIAAPGVDRSAETYEIESSYEEEFTYTLDLAVSGDFYAEVSIFGGIRIWSYTNQLAGTRFPILPAETFDLNFGGAATVGKVSPPTDFSSDTQFLPEEGIIPDPWLAVEVKDALGIPRHEPIPLKDMRRLTKLKAGPRIRSLTGLEHAVNLTELDLSNGEISNVLPLSKLRNLTTLDLSRNDISEISLSGFTNLRSLHLQNNTLSKVSLSDMPNLTELDLRGNPLSELSLSNLPNLPEMVTWDRTMLPISNSPISKLSLSGIPNITRLRSELGTLSEISLSDLPNLTNITFWHNNLSEVSLSDLPSLRQLYLENNPLSKVSLSNLPSLTRLRIRDTSVSEISLSGLPKLEELYLSRNKLSDISTLSDLPNLTRLELWNNAISDVSGLSKLSNLTYLTLSRNTISDVSGLSKLSNLTHLYLANSTISDISPLSKLPNLTHLGLWGNNISEVSLSGLPNLTELTLTDNPLSKVSVSDMPKLTSLSLFRTTISELSLSELTSLEELDIRYTPLSKVSLSNLSALKELRLSDNRLSDVSLSGLTSLTALILSHNNLSDVAFLSELTSLTELDLVRNSISDVSALSGLTNLTKLYLDINLISDVSALSGLTNLTELWLSTNSISNVSSLTELPNLTFVSLDDNPLNYASRNTHIPALWRKGVGVSFDDRTTPILEKISGEKQIGVPGSELPTPFVFQALDAEDKPIAGVSVRFVVYQGGGTLSTTTTITDATGKAETFLTLGPDPGENRVGAIADSLKTSTSFTATASHDAVVEIAEDVNGDGVITIQDLVLVSASLGEAGENAADVNGDGVVNIRDLVRVSAALQ